MTKWCSSSDRLRQLHRRFSFSVRQVCWTNYCRKLLADGGFSGEPGKVVPYRLAAAGLDRSKAEHNRRCTSSTANWSGISPVENLENFVWHISTVAQKTLSIFCYCGVHLQTWRCAAPTISVNALFSCCFAIHFFFINGCAGHHIFIDGETTSYLTRCSFVVL